jgi:3-oxoacyl-[acyl-carrier protein] reductase
MATLTNKTALITGASRGIGGATAKALAKAGARVIVHYGRAAAEADALVKEIRASGGQADPASADLSLPDGVADLATQVRAIAGEQLDVLVSNAGISRLRQSDPRLLMPCITRPASECGTCRSRWRSCCEARGKSL